MKGILVTGASGYVGSRLVVALQQAGHKVYPLVRRGEGIHGDLLDPSSLHFPEEIDVAYYLVHSMKDSRKDFVSLEERACRNFLQALERTKAKQIIFLSGLHHAEILSEHFKSRLHVEEILHSSRFTVTVVRSSIIVGEESASFEIISDLIKRLPIMIAPKWINTRCQPIAIRDVLYYLTRLLDCPQAAGKTLEIGGPDVLTFKEMLQLYAKQKGLRRWIITVPILTPRLSSYWLYLVTKVNFSLAYSLVQSLKIESIVKNHEIETLLPHQCLSYREAIGKPSSLD